MLHLPPIWLLRLTTDLQRRRHVWPSLASVPPPKIISGPNTGYLSPMSSAWTPFLPLWKTRYPSPASWRTEFGMAEPAAVVNQSRLSAYVTRSWPSRRVSPTWDSWIHAKCPMLIWIPASPTSTQVTRIRTLLHIASSPYQSKSYTEHRPLVAHLHRPRPPSTWPGLLISIFSGLVSIARPQRILCSSWQMSPYSSVPPALYCSLRPQRT